MGKAGKLGKAALGSEAELKALTHAVLKRLKEKQLEGLLQAVESRGGTRTSCLLLPGKVDSRLGQHWYSLPLLLCKIFRWPDLRHCSEVKRLCCCESYGKTHPELVCCNPHHLSRLCELGTDKGGTRVCAHTRHTYAHAHTCGLYGLHAHVCGLWTTHTGCTHVLYGLHTHVV